jgi:hypothetical protein
MSFVDMPFPIAQQLVVAEVIDKSADTSPVALFNRSPGQ